MPGNVAAQSGALARDRPPAQTVSTVRPAGRFKIETLPSRYLCQSSRSGPIRPSVDGRVSILPTTPSNRPWNASLNTRRTDTRVHQSLNMHAVLIAMIGKLCAAIPTRCSHGTS